VHGWIAVTAYASSVVSAAPCATAWNWFPTTIYPPQPGTHPTLLMRHPTDEISHPPSSTRTRFGLRGMDTTSPFRTCGGAAIPEGEFYPFRNEALDGADTIAWLRARPESNGRVGMYGFSTTA